MVQRWRTAMTEVANLSGWHLQDSCESEVIQGIVEEISSKLSRRFSGVAKNVVGILSYVEQISWDFNTRLDDVCIVGLCGMGGIGKTTIARVVYEKMSHLFESSSFLANVREVNEKHGLVPLQERFLSEILMHKNIRIWDAFQGIKEIRNKLCHKKVLVVLDDVDQLEQLRSLAGMHNWFGKGSRIIITSRDEHLLSLHGVDMLYRIEGLDHDDALQLFCLNAFKIDFPPENYVELSNYFVSYANGLPLALHILGSFLYGKSMNEWKSALDRLKEIPNKEILDKLQISFDGLSEIEKKIFLDIACFFKGKDRGHVIKILEYCGFHPDIGIRVLIDKSLITISNNSLWMHDVLQEMGWAIVRRESWEEAGKRSRLWLYSDIHHVLSNNTGTEQVEAIILDSVVQKDGHLSAKAFSKMKQLRLLKLQNLHFSEGIEYLSNKLRYVDWYGYPFKSLPSAFQPDNLVELHMRYSNIEQFWEGTKALKMLKVIDLSHSKNLIKTPDFRKVPNLEKLNLKGCTSLSEVHQSIGLLKRLTSLNLKDCKRLASLPNSLCELKSLKILILHGCSRLGKLPESLGDISCLEELDVGGVALRQLPSFRPPWCFLRGKNLHSADLMLSSLSTLCFLRELDLSNCNLTEVIIANDMSCFPLLQRLNLSGNDFVSIPTCFSQLPKLEDLSFTNCRRLHSLPDLPSSIIYLKMDGCTSLESFLPTTIRQLSKLETLSFANCKRLQSLPDLPSSIIYLCMNGCTSLKTLLPGSFSQLSNLETICFENCNRLQSLPDLPSSITFLSMDGCTSLETLPNAFEICASKPLRLTFVNCFKLIDIESGFAWLKSYLDFLLKKHPQGLFYPYCRFSMRLPGSGIPEWFNHQCISARRFLYFKMQLPPNWCNDNWMGFSICAVFGAHEPTSKASVLSCMLYATDFLNQERLPSHGWFLGEVRTEISEDTRIASDQLWFIFVPRDLKTVHWWNQCISINIHFFSNGVEVKNCKSRLVYVQDVERLVQCNSTSKNPGHLWYNKFDGHESRHSDNCYDGGSEPIENGIRYSFNKLLSKRRRTCSIQDIWCSIFRP